MLLAVVAGLSVSGGRPSAERQAESGATHQPATAPIPTDSELTLVVDARRVYHGSVNASAEACEGGRRVELFQRLPGADRRLGIAETPEAGADRGRWGIWLPPSRLRRSEVYARVVPRLVAGFRCRADESKVLSRPREIDKAS